MGNFQSFVKAVKDGNLKEVMDTFQPYLLERTIDGFSKTRPIHLACENGHLEVVKFLFQNNCSLECEAKYKSRPIHFACKNGHLEVVEFLVQNNCSLECEDEYKRRPIHFASMSGNLEVVKFLFQNKCSLECETVNKRRPIHFASMGGNLEVVKFLFQNNCSLECENECKKRPIHYACENGHLEVVKFLFQNNCSLECEAEDKSRPIHFACKNGHLEVVKFLVQNNCSLECEVENKSRPIHFACKNGHLEVVKFLVQNNCSLECENEWKIRPIHYACEMGHLEVVKFLIQSYCEVDCRTKDGKTPMQIARDRGHESCVNFLNEPMEKGRKIFHSVRRNDVQGFSELYSPGILMVEHHDDNFSLLEVALRSKAYDIIDYILNKSVNAEELSTLENYMKNSCRPGAVSIFQEYLLYRSIRFHNANGFHMSGLAKTINGQRKLVKSSFLEVAAEYGCKAFIHSLLEKCIYNDEEWTKAKDLAISKGHAEIAEAISNRKNLLRKRADKNFTWLHSAVCDNDPDMIKYILEKDLVNPNSNNEVVGTALALAHMMCYKECIKVLEKFNVDVNTQNKYSQSPLHEAIASGMIDHCSYLINRAKDIDNLGFMGFTGLQCAVIKGCEELCEELVKNGANCVRYVEIFHQSNFNTPVLPISNKENAVTLCAKIHQKIYPCLLQALDSDKLKCSEMQSVMTNEIFHVAIPDGDPKTLMSLFAKSCPAVQQLVIEDLLHHFASTDNHNDFENLLNTEVVVPKLFPNGETLLTNLLKQKKLKYCWTIINCEMNKKCIVSPNAFHETPLQICIEIELFELMNPLILNCDDKSELGFNWHIPLFSLFQKLSMSNNNEVDQKLLAAIKAIIFRGGDIYKKTLGNLPNIDYCTRFKEEIEIFQNNAKPRERDDKNICSVCLDKEVNCVLDCGHTFCMDCGAQLYRCAICNSEETNPKKLYFN